ncbi:hypothetical protein AVEN_73511-1, partial [Araneus ventricosus]
DYFPPIGGLRTEIDSHAKTPQNLVWEILYISGGLGGLVVRSRLWGRRVPGSKHDSTEDPTCMEHVAL